MIETTAPIASEVVADPDEAVAHEVGADDELLEDDLLVEDVSIDGMCGVY